jgi:hypothetical membrane protein
VGQRGRVRLRMFGSCGIVTPLVAFTCTSLAITLSPQFSWTDNALSDLGIVKGATSTFFNTGLILGGILAAMFGLGLFTILEQNTLGKLGAILFTLAAAALTAIGIFPENARPMHFYASVAFFILFPVAMLLVGGSFILLRKAKKGVLTLLAAAFAAAVWIAQFSIHYVPQVAIPETLSSLSASAWSIFLGFEMFKEGATQHHDIEPDHRPRQNELTSKSFENMNSTIYRDRVFSKPYG